MKRNIIWISAVLTLMGLLGLAFISLAVEDTWAAKANMPTARWALSTSVVNGKIYAIGGWRQITRQVSSDVEEYDPATDTWANASFSLVQRIYIADIPCDTRLTRVAKNSTATTESVDGIIFLKYIFGGIYKKI